MGDGVIVVLPDSTLKGEKGKLFTFLKCFQRRDSGKEWNNHDGTEEQPRRFE